MDARRGARREPTNNAAERGLRAAVIYRKLSLGSRSQGGERTIERLLPVDQTCRLHRRSLYAYRADVLTAKARGDPVPTHLRGRIAVSSEGRDDDEHSTGAVG